MRKVAKMYIIFCWGLFIFILMTTSLSITTQATNQFLWDKLVHFIVFGVFSFLIMRIFARQYNLGLVTVIALITSVVYIFLLEWLQLLFPYRAFSYIDIAFGISGVVTSTLGYYFYLLYVLPKEKSMLLHICCAGCGAYVSKQLIKQYQVTLFFYNPGIHPKSEYKKRVSQIKKIASLYNLDIIIAKYDHIGWLDKTKGHHKDPEGGERCMICYGDRLEKTAQTAKTGKFNFFTSTLTVSPHKNAIKINEIGRNLAKEYGINFLQENFKKQDGFKKSIQLSKKLNLYRQNYCGCEFSKK